MRADAQLFGKYLPVSLRLRQKHHKVGVFKDVLDLPAGKEVFHILRQGARDAALFTEHFPDGDEVAGSQLVLQQHMELVIVAPCSDTTGEVVGHLTVHQVVDDMHGNRAEPRPQPLQVEAHHTGVSVIHIGLVVEDVEGARHIDLKGRCQPFCLGLGLLAQKVIQILKRRHRGIVRVIEKVPVHHAGAAVNDGALHGL